MSAPYDAVLTVEHLSASVAGQQVVEDVSFSVPATGITAVLGRNGVGKTSTLKGILGLYARKGVVTLAGEVGKHLRIAQRSARRHTAT